MMEMTFQNKVCIVTGAGSGIGFTCARMLAEAGATVAMVGRNPEKIKIAADMLSGHNVHPYALDISKTAEIPAVVEKIRADLGEIDYMIQAAGMMYGGDALELTEDTWNAVMNTNGRGTFFMMQQVVKQSMAPKKSGAIVNIASMAGIRGMAVPLCSASYSASKAAVVGITMQAAVEWAGFNIRVNAIAPGGVASQGLGADAGKAPAQPPMDGGPDMSPVPSGRFTDPQEVAGTAMFLLSGMSGNTTGQVIVIDGGASVVGH
jgi:NAD(P)-dependent dehydrogenase (short-subunit alcohol dehydrogenase family)